MPERGSGRWARCKEDETHGVQFASPPCCSKKHTGQQANKYEAQLNSGDYVIAVQRLERLCESRGCERLEFVMGRRSM